MLIHSILFDKSIHVVRVIAPFVNSDHGDTVMSVIYMMDLCSYHSTKGYFKSLHIIKLPFHFKNHRIDKLTLAF